MCELATGPRPGFRAGRPDVNFGWGMDRHSRENNMLAVTRGSKIIVVSSFQLHSRGKSCHTRARTARPGLARKARRILAETRWIRGYLNPLGERHPPALRNIENGAGVRRPSKRTHPVIELFR